MTKAGLRRWLTQLSNMPMVMLEADRSDNSRAGGAAKSFDWDEFKPLFNGRALGVTGQKTAGNETYEPPFRGTLVMSQNATVQASEAIMTRIVKLHFIRPEITRESQAAADNLNHLGVLEVSHFLLMAIRAEARVLECFRERLKVHSATLRGLKQIRIERLILNHAQMMALVDALRLVVPLSEHQLACAQQTPDDDGPGAPGRRQRRRTRGGRVLGGLRLPRKPQRRAGAQPQQEPRNHRHQPQRVREARRRPPPEGGRRGNPARPAERIPQAQIHRIQGRRQRSAHGTRPPEPFHQPTQHRQVLDFPSLTGAATPEPQSDRRDTMQPLPHDYLQLIHDFQTRQQENEVAGLTALKRLLPIAQRDSGQSGVIGRFLLGLYNGQAHRFDLTELRSLDPALFDACLSVLRMDYAPKQEVHEYFENGDAIWQDLSKRWAAAKLAA
ncbi:Toprim domain-containing protein [Pseudomonas aeruginosa]|nr:Toprim domain-containing protein [Pseudomonas aeruginosa]